MSNELYRDYIDGKADEIINSLGGTITPAPANAELYRGFLDRKFDDVINAIGMGKLVKSFTYTGTGSATNEIVFPTKWNLLLHIEGMGTNDNDVVNHYPIINGVTPYIRIDYFKLAMTPVGETKAIVDMTDTTLKITMSNDGVALNRSGIEYTVYYI